MTAVTGLARFRTVALAVAWRSHHRFVSNPALFLPAALFPLFFFSAFAGGLSAVERTPGFDYPNGYTAFEFAFVLLQASAFGGVFTGFGIARDFEAGFGRRLMLAAPNRLAILVGYALSATLRALMIGGLVFAVALISGMEVSSNGFELAGLVGLAFLVNGAAAMWAAGIAFRFRTMQSGPLMQTPIFLLLFLAPVYVPIELLDDWINAVASVNPITPIVGGVRSLLAGGSEHVGLAFISAAGLLALFAVWGVRGMRRAEEAGG